ncbi:hypothetical protein D3C77_529560 [compost metagenome]
MHQPGYPAGFDAWTFGAPTALVRIPVPVLDVTFRREDPFHHLEGAFIHGVPGQAVVFTGQDLQGYVSGRVFLIVTMEVVLRVTEIHFAKHRTDEHQMVFRRLQLRH